MGWGAGAAVCQAFARQARKDRRRAEERRHIRAAQRAAVRHARISGERLEYEPDFREFPCAFVCADCGQLHSPQDPTAGHPTRRSADVGTRPETPCSHCGAQGWIDLANVAMADTLRDSEREQDRKRSHVPIVPPLLLSLVGTLVVMMTESSLGRDMTQFVMGEYVVPVWPFVAVFIFGASLGSRLWRRRQQARRLPHRWSLSPASASGPRTSGRAMGRRTLQAPLTGRPCVAYELAVHTANEPTAALGEFTLVEQRCADLEVDGTAFRGDGVRLVLRRERVELDPANARHRRAMQSRGLEPVGDAFAVFETIVAADDSVRVSGTETGATLRAA